MSFCVVTIKYYLCVFELLPGKCDKHVAPKDLNCLTKLLHSPASTGCTFMGNTYTHFVLIQLCMQIPTGLSLANNPVCNYPKTCQ